MEPIRHFKFCPSCGHSQEPATVERVFRAAFEAKTTWERGTIESLTSEMFRIGG